MVSRIQIASGSYWKLWYTLRRLKSLGRAPHLNRYLLNDVSEVDPKN